MPRTGDMTERLAFQRLTETVDAQGGYSSAWATYATIWGQIIPLTGREALAAESVTSVITYRAVIAAQQLEASAISVTSITRSGSTATLTASGVHGMNSGEYARIANANQTDYNGQVAATVTSTTAFTYTVSGSPDTPATGTITVAPLLPITAQFRISWTPSWDGGQDARTLEIHGVRMLDKTTAVLDLSEAS
jgi:head-tail adaptor